MKLKENAYYLTGSIFKLKIFVCCFIFLISCTSNTILEKPEDLIPRDKMVKLLTDVALANAAENIRNVDEKRDVNYFTVIYDKYQIDSTQFKSSSFYYASKIDDYNAMLKEVEIRLTKKVDSLREERQKADSITNSKTSIKKRLQPRESLEREN